MKPLLFPLILTSLAIIAALTGTAELAGGTVIVNAHLYGAVAGLITGMLLLWPGCNPKPARPDTDPNVKTSSMH
jgi:hypothetical protein